MLIIGLCVGCASTGTVTSEQLKYTQWQLSRVDGLAIPPSFSASMSFIEALQVNGFAGCNKFFGEGSLEEGSLTVSKLGMTRKSCGEELDEFEQQLLQTLKQGAELKMQDQQLVMQGKQKLVFIPK
ncbi:META domain-containing protein [Pseudoalteromonas sp. SG45-5]|nr:META domain-containing protein [Pseudoalteromonas sp.]MBB1385036.1 META domain-containing protein [Pseudoalteromonas sp. SG45-5]MBB1392917.1 META domain-containing protein [Pseudoalteromonas sp. SG44-4]MBB1445949.1 META domain-containing protein [Pseudoalteromonas sp. SG41-6]TMO05681.1 heat-shock protein [Pseudoalteromonas sp. S558]